MSDSESETARSLQEQVRRREIWERVEALRREVSARNRDLTDEQREALADEISREAIDSLVQKGKIKFAPLAP